MRLCVIGAGFGGLTAIRALRKALPEAKLTLIAPAKTFTYFPSLIWIPTRLREGEDLVVSLSHFLDTNNVDFHQGRVTGLAAGGRTVLTDTGPVENDGLIIASGGRFIRKLPGIENAIVPCAGVREAEQIRDSMEALFETGGTIAMGFGGNPKEPSGVHGGPVFEYMFGIETYLRKKGLRDKFNLIFFSPAPKPGVRMGEKAVERVLAEMPKRGIKTHFGHKMKGFEPGKVKTEGGDFDADLIVFMPGLTGPAWVPDTDLPTSPGGMIQADEFCRVPGFDKVYVAGDSGSYPGPDWMPKQAHMADLQAKAAAANLAGEFAGKRPGKTFRVELICIVDSFNAGTMIYRDPDRNIRLPLFQVGHWSKRWFESFYLNKFR